MSVQVRQTTPDTSGRVLPIRLDLAVEGTPEGQPVYATAPSPTPSASASSPGPTAEPSTSASTETPPSDDAVPGVRSLAIAAGVGAAVVALLGLVIGLAIRRTRSSRSAANRNG